MFDLTTILLVTTAYLLLVFFIASAAEKQWIPEHILQHPLIYTLSLGGYIGTWAVFGALELAHDSGYAFLAYFLGTSALFIFSPLILQPLLTLSRRYRLSSLADLFSFRYSSKTAGMLVSLGTLITVLPLIALQISAIGESVTFLYNNSTMPTTPFTQIIAFCFCIIIIVFTIRFGSKHLGVHARHEGLILATAFQSLVKLTLFFMLGLICIFGIFDSPLALELWLNSQPDKLEILNNSLESNNSRTMMLIFFAATLSMPHMHHLAITENRNPQSLTYASWAFPLYLLLFSLPILPIVWAGELLRNNDPTYFLSLALGKITDNSSLSLLAYVCGLASASSSTIIIIIAVASMCLNHFILPYYQPQKKTNVYTWLRIVKSSLMIALVFLSFITYLTLDTLSAFKSLRFAAYTAAFQFLPGILAVFYWPRGNRTGLIAGLVTGFTCWGIVIVLPFFSPNAFGLMPYLEPIFNLNGDNYWAVAATACLGLNMLVFGGVSIASKVNEEQINAAQICSQDNLSSPVRHQLSLHTVEDFIERLGEAIGNDIAANEVSSALKELNMQTNETRPFALRLLRNQIESNLSGLFGPTLARQLINRQIPYESAIDITAGKDIQLIEHQLENYPSDFSGLAAELDSLRRYHRNTVEHLPIGACTINSDNEIQMWNKSMELLTGINSIAALGSSLSNLSEPWRTSFLEFIQNKETELYKHGITLEGNTRWFTLHKTTPLFEGINDENKTFLMEEVTTLANLEQELLHSERLASIGRLAAGVAHEIGNPITGIACLAQNLKYDSDQPEITQAAKDILTQTERVTRIVQSLVNFAHAGANKKMIRFEPVNVHLCANEAIHLLSLDQRNITHVIHNSIAENHFAKGDMQRLLQVFLNLLKNAVLACEEDIHISLESRVLDNTVELRITDNGIGIPKDLQAQIFEPFFTTRDPGEGTGLGLSVVYSIVEEHNGHISVISPVDEVTQRGSCFIVQLPLATHTAEN